MFEEKKKVWIAGLCSAFIAGGVLVFNLAFAHGTIVTPVSRIYSCYLEGPENPQSDACKAMVALGGTQPLYDWNEVNLLAGDKHRELIPDGQLCSAGRAKYKGLNLARDDWPTQSIAADANGNYEFVYKATAHHSSKYFEFYVTKDGYDPTQPLNWSDLEDDPFCTLTSVTLEDGHYRMTCPLPSNKSGRHLIYNIWQRDDSDEAFYSCSDVEFNGVPAATATPPPIVTVPPSWDEKQYLPMISGN